jgi:hypothetical protein
VNSYGCGYCWSFISGYGKYSKGSNPYVETLKTGIVHYYPALSEFSSLSLPKIIFSIDIPALKSLTYSLGS